VSSGDKGNTIEGAGWQVGRLARGEADQFQGVGWQVGTLARGDTARQRDTGMQRSRGIVINTDTKIQGGVRTVGNLSR